MSTRMQRAAEQLMANGLTKSATLFIPANDLASIWRESGVAESDEDLKKLDRLGSCYVIVKNGDVIELA